MKIRKSLLALALSTSVAITGVATPAFAQEPEPTATEVTTPATQSVDSEEATESTASTETSTVKTEEGSSSGAAIEGQGSSVDTEKLEAAKLWMGVITAGIGVLSALFAFFAKNIAPLVMPQ